ncbi:MAG: DNA polymerase Y family protein, partial [Brachybacterium tyrofermentans]
MTLDTSTSTSTSTSTNPASTATRTVAVTVPDWPLLAALDRHQRRLVEESPDGEPAAIDPAVVPVILLDQHRVTHSSAAAREAGALPGMKRRAARAACPEALVLEADRENESALFELVAAAVDTIAAGVD